MHRLINWYPTRSVGRPQNSCTHTPFHVFWIHKFQSQQIQNYILKTFEGSLVICAGCDFPAPKIFITGLWDARIIPTCTLPSLFLSKKRIVDKVPAFSALDSTLPSEKRIVFWRTVRCQDRKKNGENNPTRIRSRWPLSKYNAH